MLALCWHNVPTYYALNYAGIFDGGLPPSNYFRDHVHTIFHYRNY